MLLGINISEQEYLGMNEKERLSLLDEAYFRARQMRLKAEAYADRLDIIRRAPEASVLNNRQLAYVDALYAGIFD